MRTLICVVSVLVALYVGEWTYRTFLRPIDQPSRYPLQHVRTAGKFLSRSSRVSALIRDGCDCLQDQRISGSVRRGRLPIRSSCWKSLAIDPTSMARPAQWGAFIEFSMWGDDTRAMVDRVSRVFLDYNPRSW